jgi:amidophosphoribosyltransferase
MKDKCGVIGIFNSNSNNILYELVYSLYALQHRGQESAGIALSNGDIIKGNGMVDNIFNNDNISRYENSEIKSTTGIGHVRYSTSRCKSIEIKNENENENECQPLRKENIAISFNGNIVISDKYDRSKNDTQFIIDYLTSQNLDIKASIIKFINEVPGSYSLLVMTFNSTFTNSTLYACRDRYGFRPLVIGKSVDNSYAIASETCAFDVINYKMIDSVKPGELIEFINNSEINRIQCIKSNLKYCIFELIYFARPDSLYDNETIDSIRRKFGSKLAQYDLINFKISQEKNWIVMPVPDSGTPAAKGYAKTINLPLIDGLIRNRYINRSFIQPTDKSRMETIRLKYNIYPNKIRDKNIILIDDSICRGNTMRHIVKLIRSAKPKSIHVRIASPPVKNPCHMGIDMPTYEELIANSYNSDEIVEYLDVDSLKYLEYENLIEVFNENKNENGFCNACFTGNYPELDW